MDKYKNKYIVKTDVFMTNKRQLDGFIFYRIGGDNTLVLQVCPNRHVKQLLKTLAIMQPIKITRFIFFNIKNDLAEFDYFSGIQYCNARNIPQINGVDLFSRVVNGEGFQVVQKEPFDRIFVAVDKSSFPDIKRS